MCFERRTDELDLRSRFEGLDIGSLSVLDLGCGYNGSPVSIQVLFLPFASLTSVDVHRPYLKRLGGRETMSGQHRIVESEIVNFVALWTDCAFDVTLLLDVVEHFTYDDAVRLLAAVEAITRKRVIIWIPLGVCLQEEYDGNPYQAHLSTWQKGDLEALGYTVDQLAHYHRPVAWARKDL